MLLIWGEGRGVSKGPAPRDSLSGLPAPLVVVSAGGRPSTLLLVLQKWQLVFWSFCILLSISCPNCNCWRLFLVPCYFFVFYCSRRCFSRCKRCSKGTQVPGPKSISNRWSVRVLRKRLLPCMWDLSSLTRDGIHTLCSGNSESYLLDCQGNCNSLKYLNMECKLEKITGNFMKK